MYNLKTINLSIINNKQPVTKITLALANKMHHMFTM